MNISDAKEAAGLLGILGRLVNGPRIKICPFDRVRDLRVWTDRITGHERPVFTLQVVNAGGMTAKECVATLEIKEAPRGVALPDKRFHLHWADEPVSDASSKASPIDLLGSEERRLDVIFAQPGVAGAWAATPFALKDLEINQAYLSPGAYVVDVIVARSGAFRHARQSFRIAVPQPGRRLRVRSLKDSDEDDGRDWTQGATTITNSVAISSMTRPGPSGRAQ